MQLPTRLLLLAGLWLPGSLRAQTQPARPDSALTEPDQELDDFSFRFNGIHPVSAKLRGVRAAHTTVYWVGADDRRLSAY